MGLFIENRLRLMIVLFLLMFFLYTAEGVFLVARDDLSEKSKQLTFDETGQEVGTGEQIKSVSGNFSESEAQESFDVWGAVLGAFSFIFLTSIEAPAWVQIPLTIGVSIMLFVSIYIAVSFVYDAVKALPFT